MTNITSHLPGISPTLPNVAERLLCSRAEAVHLQTSLLMQLMVSNPSLVSAAARRQEALVALSSSPLIEDLGISLLLERQRREREHLAFSLIERDQVTQGYL
uniref:Uncharacterized protein n=1 Tax=Grammatophora oceanica TaxID=210454 RepID=A0A7S1USJ7_9STRA|mmetsp:Transcript_20091/g.29822  ORF Transcript_20091/g.29822 Transcript_20091/m.29822 type:complete len:102 (+) Transcript_20091:717-1022(+)